MGKKLKLIVDSREQKPLEFRVEAFDEVVTTGLPVGDYWAEFDGVKLPFVFERKGLGDLFGTMTWGYERFKRMLHKAQDMKLRVILLIEGSIADVFKGYKHSQFDGDSMLKKLAMLYVRYDLEYHFFNDRNEMRRYIEETFDAVRRNYDKDK